MERSASCPRDCVYTGLCTGYLVRRTWLPSFVPNSEGLTIEKNRIACKCNLTIHQPDLRTSKQGDMASPRLRFTMCLGIWSGNQNKLVLQNLVHTCKMSLIQYPFYYPRDYLADKTMTAPPPPKTEPSHNLLRALKLL